jgi:hypothetical protein
MNYYLKRDRDSGQRDEGQDQSQWRDKSGDRGQFDESRNRVEKLERPYEWPSPPDKDKGDE